LRAGELGAQDAQEALAAAGRIGRAVVLAQRLACDRVVVAAPAGGDLEPLTAGLEMLLRALGDVPVAVCVVNHAGSLLATPEVLAELRGRIASPRPEFALDP